MLYSVKCWVSSHKLFTFSQIHIAPSLAKILTCWGCATISSGKKITSSSSRTIISATNKTTFAVTIIVTVSFIFSTSSGFNITTFIMKWRCGFAILKNEIKMYVIPQVHYCRAFMNKNQYLF